MIIELFGPPGAGKTTFARALTDRLRESGHLAELRLSYRPTERLPVLNRCGAAAGRYQNVDIHRLSRPLLEMLTIARHPIANSGARWRCGLEWRTTRRSPTPSIMHRNPTC